LLLLVFISFLKLQLLKLLAVGIMTAVTFPTVAQRPCFHDVQINSEAYPQKHSVCIWTNLFRLKVIRNAVASI